MGVLFATWASSFSANAAASCVFTACSEVVRQRYQDLCLASCHRDDGKEKDKTSGGTQRLPFLTSVSQRAVMFVVRSTPTSKHTEMTKRRWWKSLSDDGEGDDQQIIKSDSGPLKAWCRLA